MVTQNIKIIMDDRKLPDIRMVSGDVGRDIFPAVYPSEDAEEALDLTVYQLRVIFIKPDNTFVIQDYLDGMIEIPEQAGAVTGRGFYQIRLSKDGDEIYSGQGDFYIDDYILNDSMIESVAAVNGYVFPDDFLTDADLSDYAKKDYVDNAVAGLASETYVDNAVAGLASETYVDNAVAGLASETYVDNAVAGLASETYVDNAVAGLASETYVDNAISAIAPSKTATGNPIELTDSASAPMVKCVTEITGYQSGTGTPSPDNIRPIVAYTEGDIEVSDGDGNTTTHTTTYPSAIYRGSEDVVNGTVTHDMVKVVFDGSSDEDWQTEMAQAGRNFYINIPDAMYQYSSDKMCSNMFPATEVGATVKDKIWISAAKNLNVTCGDTLGISTVADFKTWLSTHNLELAYTIDTPTTSSVTPTNQPISTLSPYSHIESSTGDMEIEYINSFYQAIVDAVSLL